MFKIGKMYTPSSSFHCVRYSKKYYTMGGEVKKQLEWSFFDKITFPFTVEYGFVYRAWLRRIKSEF